jgi:phenylalanyl-tRNA synthetase beta chain
LAENVDVEYPQKLFEIGKIFELKENEIIEKDKLCISITPGNFTDLKQVLEYLSKMLELGIELAEPKQFPPHFIDGRVAEIILNKKSIGFIGEVHPKMLKEWKIKMPVSILEIYLEDIFERLK